jgi:FAD/FMN-containing dehydrogenase
LAAASGSLWNTIGGNLSSNINGKDSWCAGSFGDQVVSFKIALADGDVREVDRERDSELFEAVLGGLGLLGIVVEVRLRLRRVPSVQVERRSLPVTNSHQLAARFAELDPGTADFAYAWVDPYATDAEVGRGVFESARFVDGGSGVRQDELRRELVPPAHIAGLPPALFWGVVSRGWKALFAFGLDATAFRLMSRVKYTRAARAGDSRRIVAFADYQYPMVKIFPHWNLKFAPEGFNEVQVLLPAEGFGASLSALLAFCREHRRIPEVVAARRHRRDPYPLSFAGDGLSVTLPFSLAGFSPTGLDDYRSRLADTILELGGKIYLSKFPYLSRSVFRAMYPQWRRFAAVKERVDPERRFWSETAERLLGE